MIWGIFKDWMLAHGHYEKWLANMKMIKLRDEAGGHYYIKHNENAIASSFLWASTNEGSDYWSAVSVSWIEFYQKNGHKSDYSDALPKQTDNLFEL